MNKPTESTDPAKGLPAVKNHAALSAMDRSTRWVTVEDG